MSKYKSRKNRNTNLKSIVVTVVTVMLLMAVLSGLVALMRRDSKSDNSSATAYVDVHFVPGDSWASDDSSYGAWLWNDSGVPAGTFVLSTDEDGDGVYSVRVSSEYTNILFVDLFPGATELGSFWVNKREQTNNLLVPTDDNNIYHVYASQWSDTSDILFEETSNVLPLTIRSTVGNHKIALYCFNKFTNESEYCFISDPSYNGSYYTFLDEIPVGYTHFVLVIFDSSYEGEFNWDNAIRQTSDIIATNSNENNYFDLDNETWVIAQYEE